MPSSDWPDEKAIEAATSVVAMAPGDPEWPRRLAISLLTAAAKASPVIPAPKCETCNGYGHAAPPPSARAIAEEAAAFGVRLRNAPCPDCHGTGVAQQARDLAALRRETT